MESHSSLVLNKYQTPLSEVLKDLPDEVVSNFYTAIEELLYIRNLISADRLTIEDAPKDEEGLVEVDFSNPHILSDMEFFRQPAKRFQETGRYTDALHSTHPKSSWVTFWVEEGTKCLTRVVNPDTGEWIPGDYYFYLNYSPIMRVIKDDSGEEVDRVFDFPDVYDGDYLYYHYLYKAKKHSSRFVRGLHGAAIKCRGRGYSFKGGSMLAKRFVIGDTLRAQKKIRALALASEKEFLTKDGILNKFVDIITHCADHTGWGKSTIKISWNSMEWRSGYLTTDNFERGRKNEVIGVSMKDNPGKARGKRANLILYEEFGKFPNFLDTWRTNRPSTEAGKIAFGQQVAFGTGGEEGADFTGAEELIYHPEGYRVLGIPNIYDRGADGGTNSIFFSSELLNLEGCYDHNGNSDVTKALVHVLYERWTVRHNSSDPMAITGHIAEHPISIGEAIMRREGTLFPVADLTEYRNEIRVRGDKFFQGHYVGELVLSDSKIRYQPTDAYPIRAYELGGFDPSGAVEIFELPKNGPDDKPITGRYIAGIDPYDDDTGTSLGSIFIYDLFTDTIVAEYTGRPKFANDFYEICRRMLLFYNAIALYENNKKGLYTYFNQQSCTYLLAANPEILKDQEMMRKGSYGNKAFGVHATDQINKYALRLQRDWMLTQAHANYQDVDDDGNIISSKVNLQFIRSVGYIDEAIQWNSKGNFDRVSAMGMVMILREEKRKFIDGLKEASMPNKDLVNDDYFSKNYDSKAGQQYSYKAIEKMKKTYYS